MPFDAIASQHEHWINDAVDDLERLSHEVAPAVRSRLDATLSRMGAMNGATSLCEALVRPASTPFVAVVDACARDLGLAGDPRAALLGRSTVALYAYVRVQDDIVDEPDRVDRASVYVAEALLCEHLRLFAEAVSDPAAFAWRSKIMRRFADVAANEVDDRDGESHGEGLGWMGEKFLPMAVPMVGMAVLAGRVDVIEAMLDFVREIGTALQLVNDAFNVAEDHAGGRTTPVLRWLREAGVDMGDGMDRARLLAHPAFQRSLDEARSYVDAAEARARGLGFEALVRVAGHARGMVDRAPERLCRLMLGMSV